MISETILKSYNARLKTFDKNELIFNEQDTANFYYQIKMGSVKMFNLSEDGREFIQGIFENGKSFGEPPLLGDFLYPASAMCLEVTSLYILKKSNLLKLLSKNPLIHESFTRMLCKRMYYKATIMREVSMYPPEHRILTLLNYFKSQQQTTEAFEVPLTRQQISEMTGLRVETVIRAIKKLELQKKLSIKKRKVYI